MSRRVRQKTAAQKSKEKIPHKNPAINLLPVELLAEIFTFHVLTNYDSPVVLLLVSRRWNSVATNTQVLWTRICFGDPDAFGISEDFWRYEDLLEQWRSMIICPNATSLARALTRIGRMRFEFIIFPANVSEHPISEVKTRKMAVKDSENRHSNLQQFSTLFSASCRSLKIFSTMIPIELSPLLANLTALEEFESAHVDPDMMNAIERKNVFDFTSLQQDVLEHSTRLRTFLNSGSLPTLRSLEGLVAFGMPPQNYYPEDPIFRDLTGIEELNFTLVRTRPFVLQLGHPLPALKKLRAYGNFTQEYSLVFSQITHLAVHLCYFGTDQDKFDFPALRTLIVMRSWYVVGAIVAPNLHKMSIYGDSDVGIQCDISFCPEILHIDEFRAFETPHLLVHLAQAWRNVKTLHLTSPFNLSAQVILEMFLSPRGKEHTWIACPYLEYMSILFPVLRLRRSRAEPKKHSSQVPVPITAAERARVDGQIKKVLASKRGKELMRRLKGFRYGLYILEGCGNHFAESRRWWRTEWKEVITG